MATKQELIQALRRATQSVITWSKAHAIAFHDLSPIETLKFTQDRLDIAWARYHQALEDIEKALP